MRYAILIPARMASTRLPDKMLLAESGTPLIEHGRRRAAEAPGGPRVLVLTDDERIRAAVVAGGGEAWMTSAEHRCGTDRCAEAAARLDVPVIVNVQGDEPLFEPADLLALARAVAEEGADIATLGWPFAGDAGLADPHAVKAIVGADGWAVDFCRDGDRARVLLAAEADEGAEILHHVGIYAFRRDRLLAFPGLAPTVREQTERLEQLRALEHGWRIRVLRAGAPAFGIDTRGDYEAFLRTL